MDEMELGRSGIKLAPLGVGAMTWATTSRMAYGGTDARQAAQALAESISGGVSLVDTAESYGNEEQVGGLVNGHPEVVLATKYMPWPTRRRSSVGRALDASLARLGRDHVDLYQVHMAPKGMSIRTLMRELAVAHHDGRVRAIGVSNFNPAQLRRAHAELAIAGIPLASNQVQYSLLHRKPETSGMVDACRELGVTLIAYMPLASGALTGKYTADDRPGGVRRFLPVVSRYFSAGALEAVTPVVGLLTEIGKRHDATPPQVALRWLIQHGALPIPGAKNGTQARSNAGALHIALEPAEMDALDQATRNWRR